MPVKKVRGTKKPREAHIFKEKLVLHRCPSYCPYNYVYGYKKIKTVKVLLLWGNYPESLHIVYIIFVKDYTSSLSGGGEIPSVWNSILCYAGRAEDIENLQIFENRQAKNNNQKNKGR